MKLHEIYVKLAEISSKFGFSGVEISWNWLKSAEIAENPEIPGNSRKFPEIPEFWSEIWKKTGEQNGWLGVFARIWVEIRGGSDFGKKRGLPVFVFGRVPGIYGYRKAAFFFFAERLLHAPVDVFWICNPY